MRTSADAWIIWRRVLAEYTLQFEIVSTCFLLPAYFAYRITLVRESSLPRSSMTPIERPGQPLPRCRRVPDLFSVASLRWKSLMLRAHPALRSYRPPSYRVEVDGFWRRLGPGQVGRDQFGNPVLGPHVGEGPPSMAGIPGAEINDLCEEYAGCGKGTRGRNSASDRSATVVGQEPPDLPTEDHTNETQAGAHLYVMRCPLMDADVYKVGWTSKSPGACRRASAS